MSDGPPDRSEDRIDRPDDEDDPPDGVEGASDPFDEIDGARGDDLFDGIDDDSDADPFAELDDEAGSPDAGGDPFERMEVDEVDVAGVWDALEEDSDDLADAAFPESDPREPTDHVVDKRTYCHRCPHFAEPPETACTHEDASILEAIGFEEFRVRDCPMVTEEGPRFDRHGRLDE
jgi:hypothetical protein